jgi:hypothetical protein
MPGEIEVFRINPQVGRCYQHIEATRSQSNGLGFFSFFSTNQPRYVGKYIREESGGEGGEIQDIFDDNGTENRVNYSYQGNTCFIEVPCKLNLTSKARNQALRNIYENKTGTSAAPGNGPANLIRKYAGIELPKGSRGGMRKRSRRTRRKLKTRKHRK